jgi:hypothetical protein
MRLLASSLIVAMGLAPAATADDTWLAWPAKRAENIGRAARVTGRVGGYFDTRILSTDTSYNYKLAAAWMNPEVIRASARLAQITDRLTPAEAKRVVEEAEAVEGMVVLVEIDPREGSGVIPVDWLAVLHPISSTGERGAPVRGRLEQSLRNMRGLSGTLKRNYDYDRFWLVFPRQYSVRSTQLELVVRIAGKEGRVKWPVSEAARSLMGLAS